MISFVKRLSLFVFFCLLFICDLKSKPVSIRLSPIDSLRSEIINGQRVIIYSVNPHETLYSIARKYNINPKSLISFNHNISTLSKGQEILIPRGPAQGAVVNTSSSRPSSVITVQKGETLYSIAHARGMSAEELMKVNQLPNFSIKLGQKLYIPAFNPANPTSNGISGNQAIVPVNPIKPAEKPNSSLLPIPASGLYTIGSGETIYSIGFKYGVTVDEIRSLNNIINNEIKIGQTIRLKSDVPMPENKLVVTNAPNRNPVPIENNKPNTPLPSDIAKPDNNVSNQSIIPVTEPHRSRNIPRAFKEEGMGIWIDNNDLNQAKSVALHRLAPVGTVIKVTNPMTKKSIFVKVVGSFPVTEDTKNAVLVISKSAALLIGALDPHFRVELSYAY